MDNLIGQHVGPYRLLARVRSDGVTTVYKAHQPSTDRTVAITLLSARLRHEDALRERLQHEARTLARLQHAHTVPFFDCGQFEGRPYLVTGYVQGQTLEAYLQTRSWNRPLPLPETNRIVGQVGAGLEAAHQLGIVHQDVRPGNVLLDAEGEAFLINFGLANIVHSPGAPGWLSVGMGTPAYMSPEQVQGQPVDARSDVYSLGVLLYRMATGRLPYQAETPLGMALQQIEELPPLPRTLRLDLPESVEQVIQRALAPKPAHRFPTAGEMVAALDEARKDVEASSRDERRHAPSLVLKEPRDQRPGKGRIPSPAWAILGAMMGVLLLVLILTRLPIHVRIDGGQVEVVRVIDQTATAGAAGTPPASTPLPSPTPSSVTATPVLFPTNTPYPPVINQEARAFAEPILAAIATRPPTFSEDFEPGDTGWTWETADVGSAEPGYGIGDGVAHVELTGGVTVKLRHPQLEATDFVLSVESRQMSGTSGSEQQVFLHFAGTHFNVTIESGAGDGWAAVPWHPSGSIDLEGEIVHPMGETNQTMVVVQGGQLAVYLNGEPVLYLEEPQLHASHRISFWCHGVPDIACEFDNVQLWKMEE